ncbi:uncharacterized protein LOC144650513 [Oculina patagonica]
MEVEKNSMLPFLGTQLLNRAPRVETKVYVKPTNTGLLLHHKSHVDNRYKRSLLTTMLDRAHRLSSSWLYFSEECDRLNKVFSGLKYPQRLIDSTIINILNSRVADQQPSRTPQESTAIIRVVIPFKDKKSANYVKKQLKDLGLKVQRTVQPVFVSRKIDQGLKVQETKPQIINQQRVVYRFQCYLCDASYVGYTSGHLHTRFNVLKKCRNTFDCLVHEMLYIRELKPTLNVQSDSIRAKVFL